VKASDYIFLRPYGTNELLPGGASLWLWFSWMVVLLMAVLEGGVWSLVSVYIVPPEARNIVTSITIASLVFALMFLLLWILDASIITYDTLDLDTKNDPKASKSETPNESRNNDEAAKARKVLIRKHRTSNKLLLGIFLRMFLVAASLAITAPLLSQIIFSGEIDKRLTAQRGAERTALKLKIRDDYQKRITDQENEKKHLRQDLDTVQKPDVKDLDEEIRKQRAALDDLRGKLGKHQDELSLELTGKDGRPAGNGPIAKSQRQQIKWTQEQIISVEALLKNLTDERAGEIARVDSRRKEANQRNANNLKRIDKINTNIEILKQERDNKLATINGPITQKLQDLANYYGIPVTRDDYFTRTQLMKRIRQAGAEQQQGWVAAIARLLGWSLQDAPDAPAQGAAQSGDREEDAAIGATLAQTDWQVALPLATLFTLLLMLKLFQPRDAFYYFSGWAQQTWESYTLGHFDRDPRFTRDPRYRNGKDPTERLKPLRMFELYQEVMAGRNAALDEAIRESRVGEAKKQADSKEFLTKVFDAFTEERKHLRETDQGHRSRLELSRQEHTQKLEERAQRIEEQKATARAVEQNNLAEWLGQRQLIVEAFKRERELQQTSQISLLQAGMAELRAQKDHERHRATADERERTEKARMDAFVARRKDQFSAFQAVQKDREAAANARESAREQHEQEQVEKFLQYKNDQYAHDVRSEHAQFDAWQVQRNDRFREQSLQAYAAAKEEEQKTARHRAQANEVAVAKSIEAYAERLKRTAEITDIQTELYREMQQAEDARRDYSAKVEGEIKRQEERHKIYLEQQKRIKSLLDHENELLRQQDQSIQTTEDQCAQDEQEKRRAEGECALIEAKLKEASAQLNNITAQLTKTKDDDAQASSLRRVLAEKDQQISDLEEKKLATERTVLAKEQTRENWMSRLDNMREERTRIFERIKTLLDMSHAIDQREESFFRRDV
jgi:hypothetical protein